MGPFLAPSILEYPRFIPLGHGFMPFDRSRSDNITGKSKIINKAIQDIGMGRYQWELFVLCGFGWLADK